MIIRKHEADALFSKR